jgi:hypothetical protein
MHLLVVRLNLSMRHVVLATLVVVAVTGLSVQCVPTARKWRASLASLEARSSCRSAGHL